MEGSKSSVWVMCLALAVVVAGCGDGVVNGSFTDGGAGGTGTAGAPGAGGVPGAAGNPGAGGTGGFGTGGFGGAGATGGAPPDLPTSTDGPCTDGDDCLCDLLADEPSILGCEDFEDPDLPNYGAQKGWHDRYSNGVSGCTADADDIDLFRTRFGRANNACVDIVQEGDCEVPGQIDCVFGGYRALDHRAVAGRTGGITGTMRWPASRRFGLTMALKYSHNYITPGSAERSGPAHKMNEFGDLKHPIIGASTGDRNHPYGGAVLRMVNGGASASFDVVVGSAGTTRDTGAFRLDVDRTVYNWVDSANGQPATHGPDEWICLQQHWDGWGTANATVRAWMDGELVMHVRNIDMRAIDNDEDGINSLVFNNYYNGVVTPGNGRSGYPGPETAARYEDNVVVTSASEPVPCAVIGFEGLEN